VWWIAQRCGLDIEHAVWFPLYKFDHSTNAKQILYAGFQFLFKYSALPQ
jgi:hypothetical protein